MGGMEGCIGVSAKIHVELVSGTLLLLQFPSFHQHQDHFLFLPTLPPTRIFVIACWGLLLRFVSLGVGSHVMLLGMGWGKGVKVKVMGSDQQDLPQPPSSHPTPSSHLLLLISVNIVPDIVPNPCYPVTFPEQAGGFPLGPLVDSVTCGFSRWPWRARVFGCALFYSLDHPSLSSSSRIPHSLQTQFFI